MTSKHQIFLSVENIKDELRMIQNTLLVSDAPEIMAALKAALRCLELIPTLAYENNLAGTKEWDQVCGGANLFCVIDSIRAAVKKYD